VKPEALRKGLPQLWEKVRRAGWGRRFTTTLPSGEHQGTYYTVALEGSEYCRSTQIQCPHCLRQTDPQGRGHYAHKIVSATVVRAGSHHVLPLDVEEVRKATAESAPQDCELTAGKRLITRLRQEHPQMALTGGRSSGPPVRARHAADVPITARTRTQPRISTVQVERLLASTRNRAMP